MRSVLTYDIGGTTVSAAIVGADTLSPEGVKVVERPIHASGGRGEIYEDLARLRDAVAEGEEIDGVAVAMPGPSDYHSGTCWMTHKLAALYGTSLAPLLGVEDRPIAFINDAAAFGLAEARVGAGRGKQRCLALTLGTGLGSAFTIGAEVATDHPDVPTAGELWNLPHPDGTSRTIEQAYQEVVRSVPSLPEAARAASAETPPALFVRLGETIADAIAPAVERFAADQVILGGGVSRSAPLFGPALRRRLRQHLGAGCQQVSPAELGNAAAHIGARIALQQRLQRFARRQLIYLHGMASGPGAAKAVRFRDDLARRGVELQVPALDGGDFHNMTVSRQLEILDRLMRGQPAGSVVLIGSSLGGYTSAIQASRCEAIAALVLMAPALDFARGFERKMGAEAIARWQREGELSVMHYATEQEAAISWSLMEDGRKQPAYPDVRVPTLIFHGTDDDSVLPEVSIHFAERPNVELRLLEADHGLSAAIDTIIDQALRFLSVWWA